MPLSAQRCTFEYKPAEGSASLSEIAVYISGYKFKQDSFTRFSCVFGGFVLKCSTALSMIPRNHIKMRSTFPHQIRPLQVHQKQDADRRHTPRSEEGVILWSQFHKVSQPDWLPRNETTFLKWCAAGAFPLPTVVILSPGVLAHTHTQSSQRLQLLTRLRTARRPDWGQRSHECISGGRHHYVPIFLSASSYLRTGKWEQGVQQMNVPTCLCNSVYIGSTSFFLLYVSSRTDISQRPCLESRRKFWPWTKSLLPEAAENVSQAAVNK